MSSLANLANHGDTIVTYHNSAIHTTNPNMQPIPTLEVNELYPKLVLIL